MITIDKTLIQHHVCKKLYYANNQVYQSSNLRFTNKLNTINLHNNILSTGQRMV